METVAVTTIIMTIVAATIMNTIMRTVAATTIITTIAAATTTNKAVQAINLKQKKQPMMRLLLSLDF